MKMELKQVEVEVFCHATEDEAKVREALEAFFDFGFQTQKAWGYWKNPIQLLRGKGGPEKAQKILKKLEVLPVNKPIKYCDNNEFYARISKESLFSDNIKQGNDIKLVFRFQGYPTSADKVARAVQGIWKA